MKFLLRLRHWQLFLLTWGLPIALNFLTFFNTGLPVLGVFPIMMILFTFGVFGWVWAISTELHKKLPIEVKLNVGQFKIFFLIPIVYILGITIWMSSSFFGGSNGQSDNMSAAIGLIIVLHLLSMVCIFLGLRFAAKTMKSVELGRMAKFGDYAGEFFLIWFSVAGVWVLQPRLNKLIED
jgi:hypothetical protein